MNGIDPRLLRYARATRVYLITTVVLGLVTATLVITQAWLLARLIWGGFLGAQSLADMKVPLAALAAIVIGRAAVAWLGELAANRTSARVKSQLRARLLERVVELGPNALGERRTGELTSLATGGVDALDGYFARYLPALVLAIVVPAAVLVSILRADWVAAAIVVVTLPLVPVFMVLIGVNTGQRTDRQLRSLQVLANHFLDVVAGLPTLKVFGRAKAQAESIRHVTEEYRRRTMQALRLAFVSSLVLELIATISLALVAVSVGLRLLSGGLGFRTALFVLVLAPEAYLPLRTLGASFHASADGVAAADQVFAVLDEPVPHRGRRLDVPSPATAALVVEQLTVSYPGRGAPALDDVSFRVEPGEIVAISGPSGAGKSTLMAVLLRFVEPAAGRVMVGGVDLADLDPDAWRARTAWVPQRPYLFAASLDANVRLGRPDASAAAVDEAVAAAGLSDLVGRLPRGLDSRLGEGGAGLSAGERQRVAMARAFLRDAPLLLLDEPTSALDGPGETEVVAALRLLARGRTVLLAAHRPSLLALAHRQVQLPVGWAISRPAAKVTG